MLIRNASSERGAAAAISPARFGSSKDKRGQERDADNGEPAKEAVTSEQAPSVQASHQVDKSA